MLKNLSIKNVALIKQAEIEFNKGLNVLSGETGAGKSVVLESLNFALGHKADKSMISHGENECSVSCTFSVDNSLGAKNALSEIGVDFDDEVVVKRTLNIDGKSTIRLNGEPVTATMLRKVTCELVDVHGQSDHFVLLKEANQLALIDGLGGEKLSAIKSKISLILDQIKDIDRTLDSLGGSREDRERKIDYLQFAIDEIEKLNLNEGEEEELLDRKKRLLNVEKISLACGDSYSAITMENGVTDLIGSVCRKISGLTQFGNEFQDILVRLENSLEEIEDIAETINDCCDEEYDQNQIEFIEQRLNAINNVKRKYGKSYKDIIASLQKFKDELDLISDSAEKTAKLVAEKSELLKKLNILYDDLSDLRRQVAKNLSEKLSLKLRELAMKNAVFTVDFSTLDGQVLSSKGRDTVCFMFTSNKGEELKPLSKIISGGELSRLMLGIKAITGGSFGTETFIFDEIDAGISGETASVVAENFAKISKDRQIIAISHLPQIVAMADTGFLIYKFEDEARTRTVIKQLDNQGKIYEVLRLIGGNLNSDVAITHAKNMVLASDDFKKTI